MPKICYGMSKQEYTGLNLKYVVGNKTDDDKALIQSQFL